MFTIYTCTKCGSKISMKPIKGIVHIVCPSCHKKYQLTQRSMKLQMLVPLLSVGIAVGSSVTIFRDASLDFKAIYILSCALLISILISYIMSKGNFITYEDKES